MRACDGELILLQLYHRQRNGKRISRSGVYWVIPGNSNMYSSNIDVHSVDSSSVLRQFRINLYSKLSTPRSHLTTAFTCYHPLHHNRTARKLISWLYLPTTTWLNRFQIVQGKQWSLTSFSYRALQLRYRFCDATIVMLHVGEEADSGIFRVHKHLICQASLVFKANFMGGVAENSKQMMLLHTNQKMLWNALSNGYTPKTLSCPMIPMRKVLPIATNSLQSCMFSQADMVSANSIILSLISSSCLGIISSHDHFHLPWWPIFTPTLQNSRHFESSWFGCSLVIWRPVITICLAYEAGSNKPRNSLQTLQSPW